MCHGSEGDGEKREGKSRILKCKKNITNAGVIIRTVKIFDYYSKA